MKLRQFRSRKIYIAAGAILAGVVVILGSTFAWMVANDSKKNPFAVNINFKVELVDKFVSGIKYTYDSSSQPSGFQPNTKVVGATNTGTMPAVVRIMALPTLISANGTPLEANFGTELTADFNTTDWVDGGDGWYYYLHVLPARKTTDTNPPNIGQNLFTKVQLTQSFSNNQEYANAALDVQVKMEAVEPGDYMKAWWNGTPPTTQLRTIATNIQNAIKAFNG